MGTLWRRYNTYIITGFFILLILLMSIMGLVVVKKYNKKILERDTHITNLETTINNIGELKKGFVTKANVRPGDKITEDNITEVDVPSKLGLNVATYEDEIVGKYYKIGLSEGTVITKEDAIAEQLDNSARYFDLILDELPIGLIEGDYIDIRISLPLGEDFIAISHKRVEEINSGIPKVVINENEILTYNSMLVDKVLYKGSKMYAVKYKEAGAQSAAETFYPVNKNIQDMVAIDPGLLAAVKQEMVLKRASIESKLGGLDTKTDTEYERLISEIEQARNRMNSSITQSQRDLERRIEREKIESAQQG